MSPKFKSSLSRSSRNANCTRHMRSACAKQPQRFGRTSEVRDSLMRHSRARVPVTRKRRRATHTLQGMEPTACLVKLPSWSRTKEESAALCHAMRLGDRPVSVQNQAYPPAWGIARNPDHFMHPHCGWLRPCIDSRYSRTAMRGHVHLADDLRVARRSGIDINHGKRVGNTALRIEGRHVGQLFARRLHRHAR